MSLTVAAFWYAIDQNEPSRPLLLDLDCPAEPTLQEFEQALTAYFVATRQKERDEYEREFGVPLADTPLSAEFSLCPNGYPGDAQVNDANVFLFVGVSGALCDRLIIPGNRPDTSS